jgi:16S rRNA (uracil1498-N3)-methyltransferase
MPKLFLSAADMSVRPLAIRGEKAKYLAAVLRCRPGDRMVIHDGQGNSYTAEITAVTVGEVTADLLEKIKWEADSELHIALLQGLLKGEKMDYVIQKATELGVREIVPVVTERSQLRETRKVPRWRKIAEEAARQSGRNSVPRIHEATGFEELPVDALPKGILFWEQGGSDFGGALRRLEGLGAISLFTGPEGGFSEKEIASATGKGFLVATLGRRILRAETAAITAVAITQFALGDLGR